MKEIKLFGAGGHCFAVTDLIQSLNTYKPAIIFDDNPKQEEILSVPVKKFNNNNLSMSPLCITIGNNLIRKNISKKFDAEYPVFIHKSAQVYNSSSIGKGTVVLPNSVIGSSVSIGEFCIINNNATISHNSILSDFIHIAINVAVSGGVKIGEGAFLGAGCVILPEVKIGKWAIVGAGAVVTKDIPDNCTAVGAPAKPIKFH